jgi:hypothetical protein
MLNMQNNTKNVLRWISLPFGSFIIALIISLISGLICHVSYTRFDEVIRGYYDYGGEFYDLYIAPIIVFIISYIFGGTFALACIKIAPKAKLIAASVLVTILCMVLLSSVIFSFFLMEPTGTQIVTELIRILGIIVGAVQAIFYFNNTEESFFKN